MMREREGGDPQPLQEWRELCYKGHTFLSPTLDTYYQIYGVSKFKLG
jgi:hypothetical protein